MIPAAGRYIARFRHDPEKPRHLNPATMPVEAFSDTGAALVLDREGILFPAHEIDGFIEVAPAPPRNLAVIPGGGWKLDTGDTAGNQWTDDLVGWLVDEDGTATPLIVHQDTDLYARPVGDSSNPGRLMPPAAPPVTPVTP